jgi:hypothetical protein
MGYVKSLLRLALAGLFIGLAWTGLCSYLNTRTTTLEVRIAGQLDEVSLYRETPEERVAQIQTHGLDTTATVELRSARDGVWWLQALPAKYYFVAVKGGQHYRSTAVCCQTGIVNQRGWLTIRDFDDWEQRHP